MKRITLLVLAVLLLTPFAVYAEGAKVSGSASVDIMSSYIWRGFELHEDAALQPSVGITYGGFGANIWSDYNTDTKEAVETDVTLNYTFSVDKLGFEAGYIYYALDDAADTREAYLSVGYDTILSPTLTVYYDFDEGEGTFFTFSVRHDFTFEKDIMLSLGGSLSYNANSEYSIGDYSEFHNADLSASLSIPITDGLSISPVVAYTFDLSDEAEIAIMGLSTDGDESRFFYGGVNVSLSF